MYINFTISGTGNVDDWFFTPDLQLNGGQTYILSFNYKGGNSIYVERLEVKCGQGANANSMTDSLFKNIDFYIPSYQSINVNYTPQTTGLYNFGWHAFSQNNQLGINVDDISINIASDSSDITSFIIPNQVGNTIINQIDTSITITMPYGSELNSLTPTTITLSQYAIGTMNSGSTYNYINTLIDTVIAQNEINKKLWKINIINMLNDSAYFKTFYIPNQIGESFINNNNSIITVNMPFGTIVSELTPTYTLSNGAVASPESEIAQNFTNPIQYIVTAENGNIKNWLVTVNVDNGIKTISNDKISIYPNPSKGIFKLIVDEKYNMKIFDATGRLILNQFIEKGNNIIDIKSNNAGVYSLRLINDNEVQNIRLIKNL